MSTSAFVLTRVHQPTAPRRPRQRVQTAALFGFGKKDSAAEAEREAAFQAQQELLRARRTGEDLKRANERRAKVSQYIQEEKAARKKAWKEGKNVELPGRGKSTIEQIREQYGDDSNSGIVVPLAPFGIPKYDQGERFDLQAPYADEGYPDESADPMTALKRLFGMGKKGEDDKKDGKKGQK